MGSWMWEEVRAAFLFQKGVTADFVFGMSLLEKLMLGAALGFFGLMTLYVLLTKTATLNVLPRILFRLTLLLGVLASFATSYFIMADFLVQPQRPAAASAPPSSSPASSQSPGAAERPRSDREIQMQEALEP